jgi:elongation factor P
MDTETFEQIEVPEDTIGEPAKFLKDNTMADILFYDDNKILGVEIPVHMILEVTEASIAVRGDTATNVLKQVTLETGAIVQVPGFVNQGDTIKIDTRTGQYIERM